MRFFALLIALACVAASTLVLVADDSLAGYAADARNPFNRDYSIHHAATLSVTARGQRFFQGQLLEILRKNQKDLSRGSWAQKDMTFAYRLEDLPAQLKDYGPALISIRDHIGEVFKGFSLKNPRIMLVARELGYRAEDMELGVRADWEMTQKLEGQGVAFLVEAKLPKLELFAGQVAASDLNNPMLGNFGIDNARLELSHHAQEPLEVAVLLQVNLLPGGRIRAKTLDVRTNLDKVAFSLPKENAWKTDKELEKAGKKLSRPNSIWMPTYGTWAGSTDKDIKNQPILDSIRRNEAQLVRVLQYHLKKLARRELPEYLDSQAFAELAGGIEHVEPMDVPGVDTFGSKLDWGMRAAGLSLTPEFLQVDLDGYVADPEVTWDEAELASDHPAPQLKAMPSDQYDYAFSINQDVLNRLLVHAVRRGALAGAGNAGRPMRFVEPPKLILERKAGAAARIHALVEMEPEGFKQNVGLKDKFQAEINVEIEARLAELPNYFNFVIRRIDTESARIDDRFLDVDSASYVPTIGFQKVGPISLPTVGTYDLATLRKAVAETLRADLDARNATYAKNYEAGKPDTLTEKPIQIPKEISGVATQLKGVDLDPSGYLVLYLTRGENVK